MFGVKARAWSRSRFEYSIYRSSESESKLDSDRFSVFMIQSCPQPLEQQIPPIDLHWMPPFAQTAGTMHAPNFGGGGHVGVGIVVGPTCPGSLQY